MSVRRSGSTSARRRRVHAGWSAGAGLWLGLFGCDPAEVTSAEVKPAEVKPAEAKSDRGAAPSPSESNTAGAATPGAAAPAPKADAAARPAAPAGVAYFAVRGKGIVQLGADGFSAVPGAAQTRTTDLVLGPGDALYGLTKTGVGRVEGGSWVLKFPFAASERAGWGGLAVASDGTPWIVGTAGVAHAQGERWRVEPAAAVGAGEGLLDIAVDAEGRPWVAGSSGLRYRDERGWHTADARAFITISADPQGDGLLAFGVSPARVRGPAAIADLPGSWPGSKAAAAAMWGTATTLAAAWTGEGDVRVHWRDAFGKGHYTHQDVLPGQVSILAMDAGARVWTSTDAGLTVLSPSGNVSWPLGSVPEVAGPIDALRVVQGGPALPDAGPIRTGTLEGTLLLGGAPIADAPLELCPQPATRVTTSPCESSGLRRALVTDAQGRFAAADIPLGAYGLAVQVEGAWKITFGGAYGAEMAANERFDIGSLDFAASR